MVPIRYAPDATKNDLLTHIPAEQGESNQTWLKRSGTLDRVKDQGGIILLGGTSMAHFRIRVAQSHLRSDLLPSFWSLAGALVDDQKFASVPLDLCGDISEVAQNNGVSECLLTDYDNPERFPNIAVLQFTSDPEPIYANITEIKRQRSIIDLPNLIVHWLNFVWATGQSGNPLLAGYGLPSAAFIETAYGIAGLELTPGLSSASSCPEAIWQTVKWWRKFYEETNGTGVGSQVKAIVPTGKFAVRQPAATVVQNEIVF
jgi:hypothetical protein